MEGRCRCDTCLSPDSFKRYFMWKELKREQTKEDRPFIHKAVSEKCVCGSPHLNVCSVQAVCCVTKTGVPCVYVCWQALLWVVWLLILYTCFSKWHSIDYHLATHRLTNYCKCSQRNKEGTLVTYDLILGQRKQECEIYHADRWRIFTLRDSKI